MIKKGLLTTLVFVLFTNFIYAQKHNIVNASIALRNEEYVDAKKYIDEAYETESTSNDAKMWNYRSQIYLQIALKQADLDEDAIFKATEAHLKCLQTDKKGRVVVRKWTSKEDVLSGTVNCGYKLFNKAVEEYSAGNYKSSLKHYAAIFEIIPFDTEDQLKRGNITIETIYMNSYLAASKMKDNKQSKEFLQKLIDVNFNDPRIYAYMSNIYIEEENTDKALEYLTYGRDMFDTDQSLLNAEINLYIKLGRTSELINKLGEAIALDEENDLWYFNRGTIYDQEGDIVNAEKDYLTALKLNPLSFGANYNLGALYFNKGGETKNKANATSNNSLYKKLNKESDAVFAKALPYLETAHELNSEDKNTLLSLKQLYYLNSDYKKSDEMKKLIAESK